TVALLFLYPRMPSVKIVGTDIAHAVPLTAIAGMGHLALGTVDLVLLASLLLGSLPGIYIGSHLSAKVPEKVLSPILAAMLLLIGLKMVFY
ncbi:MAG: sulfite exporter TauE/SafE family protein, partial [Gallionella sp.]